MVMARDVFFMRVQRSYRDSNISFEPTSCMRNRNPLIIMGVLVADDRIFDKTWIIFNYSHDIMNGLDHGP